MRWKGKTLKTSHPIPDRSLQGNARTNWSWAFSSLLSPSDRLSHLADCQIGKLLVRDRDDLAIGGVGFDDQVAVLVTHWIVDPPPVVAIPELGYFATPPLNKELNGRERGHGTSRPLGALRDLAVGRHEVAAHLSHNPVGIVPHWERAKSGFVVDRHIGPVVLDEWLRDEHHLLMEGSSRKQGSFQTVMGAGFADDQPTFMSRELG